MAENWQQQLEAELNALEFVKRHAGASSTAESPQESVQGLESATRAFSKLKQKWQNLETKQAQLEQIADASTLEIDPSKKAQLETLVTSGKREIREVKKQLEAIKSEMRQAIDSIVIQYATLVDARAKIESTYNPEAAQQYASFLALQPQLAAEVGAPSGACDVELTSDAGLSELVSQQRALLQQFAGEVQSLTEAKQTYQYELAPARTQAEQMRAELLALEEEEKLLLQRERDAKALQTKRSEQYDELSSISGVAVEDAGAPDSARILFRASTQTHPCHQLVVKFTPDTSRLLSAELSPNNVYIADLVSTVLSSQKQQQQSVPPTASLIATGQVPAEEPVRGLSWLVREVQARLLHSKPRQQLIQKLAESFAVDVDDAFESDRLTVTISEPVPALLTLRVPFEFPMPHVRISLEDVMGLDGAELPAQAVQRAKEAIVSRSGISLPDVIKLAAAELSTA